MRILLLLLVIAAPNLWAKAMVWQISDGERTLYLAGTMHLLSKADYPLPKAYENAYAKADILYFEALKYTLPIIFGKLYSVYKITYLYW